MKIAQVFMLFLLLLDLSLQDQQIGFAHDWKMMLQAYNNLDGKEVATTYYLYDTHNSQKHSEITSAIVARKGRNVYQKIDNIEYIVDEQHMVMIDHSDRVIIFDRVVKDFNPITPNIDMSYLGHYVSSEKKLFDSKGERKYSIVFTEGEVEKLEATFYTNTMLLKEVTIFYAEKDDVDDENKPIRVKQKMKITFNQPLSIKNKLSTIFDNQFFNFVGKKISLKHKYCKYELIDNRI